jgi:hypothetical protein
MKVRQGFVSNSSSSSFIVAFPKDIALTPTAVHDYLYGASWDGAISVPWSDGEYDLPTTVAARIVCERLLGQKPNDPVALHRAVQGYIDGGPDSADFRRKVKGQASYETDWDAFEKADQAFRKEFLDRVVPELSKNGELDLYTFEFADAERVGATLEHGDTFRRVPHVRVSNH